MARVPILRKDFKFFHEMSTRWRDNDVYAHVNNAVFYEYVDTAVNFWIATEGGLDVPHSGIVGLVVSSSCEYFSPLAFPDPVTGGVRVANIGNSSVTYEVALFRGEASEAAACARFTHVYVGRDDKRPVTLPDNFRAALGTLLP